MNKMKPSNYDVIEAAGGLLWRGSPGELEIAVIHRPRYDDWTLPKGKREPGESWADTAMREVHEETGCTARLGDFAGGIIYTVLGTPKVVLFWHMIFEADPGFKPTDEVDRLLWLKPDEAREIMSYQAELELIPSTGLDSIFKADK